MKALDIQNLRKSYESTDAVKNISFSIEPGEFFGFLGPNGAGKTSTIKCTTGIASFQGGTIKVFGIDVVADYREARKKVGLAPQDFNVDILWYVGGYYGIPSASRKKSVDDVLERFELGAHSKKSFMALSGGLKRRVMLARAMVHDPDLLILDEPTAGVDVEMRHDLWRYLQDLNKAGKTILLTSHYLEEVEFLCNRIAIINGGKIAALGDKSEFTTGGKKLEQTYLEITKDGKSL
jgi:ABC-2 type transport system ATP-binding protein